MTRPRGDVRLALEQAARQLHAERGDGANWRELAQRACVGYDKAKQTVRDMVRAGDLQACGHERVAHARRPMVRFVPGSSWSLSAPTGLLAVMRHWR